MIVISSEVISVRAAIIPTSHQKECTCTFSIHPHSEHWFVLAPAVDTCALYTNKHHKYMQNDHDAHENTCSQPKVAEAMYV